MANEHLSNNALKIAATILGCVVMLLGAIVLLGWHIHSPLLIQVHPSFVPMQYNTALGFFFGGAGFLSLLKGWTRYSIGFNAIVAAVGILTLLEYILGIDFGIDELFMIHDITVKTSHPGRMAPNTALCFTLAGISNIMISGVIRRQKSGLISGICAALVVALGLVALTGYISGLETAYGWGRLTRMALHTSAGFVVLGVAGLTMAWKKQPEIESGLPAWVSAASGIFVLTVTICLWQAIDAQTLIVEGKIGNQTDIIADDLMLIFGVMLALAMTLIINQGQKARQRALQAERAKTILNESARSCKNSI